MQGLSVDQATKEKIADKVEEFRSENMFKAVLRIRSFWVTRIRIRENTGSGSFIFKKTPEILIFSFYKIVWNTVSSKYLLSLILSVIRCLDLVRKAIKNIYFAKHQKHI